MVEYIEREAAIDAIMKVYVRTAGYKARERVIEAEEAVHRLPVADVVPVVRCKDCIYEKDAKWNRKGFRICPATHMEIVDDDLCSYGERKEKNNDTD